jgi:hypothetical protein
LLTHERKTVGALVEVDDQRWDWQVTHTFPQIPEIRSPPRNPAFCRSLVVVLNILRGHIGENVAAPCTARCGWSRETVVSSRRCPTVSFQTIVAMRRERRDAIDTEPSLTL